MQTLKTNDNTIIPNNLLVSNDMITLVEKKTHFFEDIIQKTLLHVRQNKLLDILGINEVNNCINSLYELSKKIKEITLGIQSLTQGNHNLTHPQINLTNDILINNLQLINNELSSLFKIFGTKSLEDLLWICFGNNYTSAISSIIDFEEKDKFELLKKYFHPIGYKVVNSNSKPLKDEKKIKQGLNATKEDYELIEQSKNIDCTELQSDKFYLKVYGMKVVIINKLQNKSLIISGIVDDIIIDFLNNSYINSQLSYIKHNLPNENDFHNSNFDKFISSLTLKEYFINRSNDYYAKYIGINSNIIYLHKQPLQTVVKEFISSDMYIKRNTIINLLIYSDNYENQYLAYLLYDLLSNDNNGLVDTQEQITLFDSFSWNIKIFFRDAMKKTIKYTNELSNFDINKIPLEQQICLLKVNDAVKEKAMQKLKEVKSKSEDSGSKARQYLDGLLKIPFNIFKKEPILNKMDEICKQFKDLYKTHININFQSNTSLIESVPLKEKYTSMEIIKYLNIIKKNTQYQIIEYEKIYTKIGKKDKKDIIECAKLFNEFIKVNNLNYEAIVTLKRDKQTILNDILETSKYCINNCKHQYNVFLLENFNENKSPSHSSNSKNKVNVQLLKNINEIESNLQMIGSYITNVKSIMDKSIYGHDKAKKQIERIICQWINGEQDGYCFGFEGPPGVGKTSLAKYGLSRCLTDEHNVSRPFSMIQIGGDSNGSSLHGHNYTYVGSNWGAIVQILIDKKCMNPIIFIDEIDKISKTEQGREIVGILTHLLDTTQNDCFQDKYFSGVDLDLSKALFILSYNDVASIDKILLDRIHRVKFSNLSVEEKIVISKKHILPEIYKKMGLENMIEISDEILEFIIDTYTCEPGVRKLKEILFEIVGEINNNVLTNLTTITEYDIPLLLTKEQIQTLYLKERQEIKHKKIHKINMVGTINGLWANALGQGGVIPIQTCFLPCSKFLELKLTGMQGDVMKESMNVALTIAWNMTKKERKQELKEEFNGFGIHIHCPEGATPKDGPSAGTAITCALYSLFNNKKIKYDLALTGEISLDGNVTEIGGLDLKILGGIKAGIKTFLYPTENHKDYIRFIEKYKECDLIKDIAFKSVSHISEVFECVFE
jgi:ATP-dependent Lon protease